jgi:ATP-dependent helicase IRC3
VEIEQAERAADPTADVVIASVPTLGTRLSERLAKFDPQLFKCIIIDEAHHAPTESFGRVLNHFGVLSDDSHIFLWGCSATPARFVFHCSSTSILADILNKL